MRLVFSYRLLSYWVICLVILACGCTDPRSVFDNSKEIVNHNWSYGNKVRYEVDIQDPAVGYNLYMNLRVSAEYKYSNIFAIIYIGGGSMAKPKAVRYEFPLATKTGEWLGKGSGSLYSYQLLFQKNYHFPAKGKYYFEIEQNMRDNPLKAVTDAGIRVEKVQ